jgi:predicted nucleic acid-binding protein
MDARKIALREGISLSGSVGVLVTQVRREIMLLSEANEVLQNMTASGYYAPVEKLDDLI